MTTSPPRVSSSRRARYGTFVAALVLAAVAPRAYAQFRIAVVDIRRAIAETNEGRNASQAIKTRFDQRQSDLNRRGAELERLKRRIESRRDPMAALQKMAQRYQRDVMEYQQLSQQYTAEIQQMESEMTKTILVKMQPLLREVGQSDNFQLIVDEQVVHFAPAHLNLTDRVVQVYNQRNPATLQAPANADAGAARADAAAPARSDAGASGGGTGPVDVPPPPMADAGRTGPLPGVFFRRDGGR